MQHFFWLLNSVSNDCSKTGALDFIDIFNDNGNDKLLNGGRLKKMPPHVMMHFTDHKKQKHLVVLVVLPMAVMHYNTKLWTLWSEADRMNCRLKIIWLHNMMDVSKLLSQFPDAWHGHDIRFGDGEVLQPIKGEGCRFCLDKGEHPLTIYCSVEV